MSTREFLSRLGGNFKRNERDRALAEELESNIQLHTEENLRQGMSPEQARRAAVLRFGSVEATKEEYRDQRGLPWLAHLGQDVRFGLRMLAKNPGFALAGILALALGIGANSALFSVVYGVLIKPLPYREGSRLMVIEQPAPPLGVQNAAFSVKEITDYRARTRTLQQLEEFHSMSFILLGPKPDRVKTGVVSHGFFSMLGIQPVLGRNFTAADDEPNAPAVLLLSNAYWKSMFGGDPNVVGRTVKMNDKLHTIVGVLPPIPQYPRDNDVYMPVSACPFRMNAHHLNDRDARMMGVIARLKDGISAEAANSEMAAIAAAFTRELPGAYPAAEGLTATATPLQKQLTDRARPMLLLLLSVAGLVLLICCTNVANLALARIMRRDREFAIRRSLGASRGRLAKQMLTESIMLALIGAALGLLLAAAAIPLLAQFITRLTSRGNGITLNLPVLGFTLLLAIATGLLFGLLPALSAGRRIHAGTATADRQRQAMRSGLIVAQVALSFVLLSAAGLMMRSLLKLQRVDAGYNADHVLTARLPGNFTKRNNDKTQRPFDEAVLAAAQRIPGVTEAALISLEPLAATRPNKNSFEVEGQPLAANQPKPVGNFETVTPGAFHALEIPLVRGRLLSESDGPDAPLVLVINQSLAKHYFGNADPIGHRISGDGGKHWATIVGVVGDIREFGLDQQPVDTAYISAEQSPGTGVVLLRTQVEPRSVVPMLRSAIASVDPEEPVVDIHTLDELRDDSLAQTRVTALLIALFAGIALAIAATGLAGITSYVVSQRTREIGIRIALGATVRQVLGLVLSHGLKLIVAGAVAGIALSLFSGRALQNLLFGVKPVDWLSLGGVAALMLGVALFASYLPARRATKVDPMIALRCD